MAKLIISILSVVLAFAANADQYPTSKIPAKGDWKEMGHNPYKGSWEKGCNDLGLNADVCATYKKARETGACEYKDVPTDGSVVLDKLLFGNGEVQTNARVVLESAPTLRSLVCKVKGMAIIAYDGCSNLGLVNNWPVGPVATTGKGPVVQVDEPNFGGDVCSPDDGNRLIFLSIYDEATPSVNACAAGAILPWRVKRPAGATGKHAGTGLEDNLLSRKCGTLLDKDYNAGRIGLGDMNHTYRVVVRDSEGPHQVARIAQVGRKMTVVEGQENVVNGFVNIGPAYTEGTVEIIFDTYGKLTSPTPAGMIEDIAKLSRGCEISLYSAIEGTPPSQPAEPAPAISSADQGGAPALVAH